MNRPAPESERPPSTLAGLAVAASGAGLIWLFRGLLLPLLLGSLGAYLAQPMVARLEARGLRRGVVVLVLFGLGALVVTTLTLSLAPVAQRQASALVAQLPTFAERLETVSGAAHREITTRVPALAEHLPYPAPGWPERLVANQKRHLGAVMSGAGAVLFVVFLAPVFGFFLLRDGGRLLEGLVRVLPARHIETTVAIWCEVDRLIGRYLRGLLIESTAIAILAAVGLAVLDVPAPLVLGTLAGLLNPLPYVGVLLSLSVALVTALGSGMGADTLVAIVVLFVGLRLFDDFVLVPIALGGSVHLHPGLAIAAILAGEQALGVLGMVLAVPLVTVVKEVAGLLLEGARRGRGAPASRAAAAPSYVC